MQLKNTMDKKHKKENRGTNEIKKINHINKRINFQKKGQTFH
jgi:hypothetical protein